MSILTDVLGNIGLVIFCIGTVGMFITLLISSILAIKLRLRENKLSKTKIQQTYKQQNNPWQPYGSNAKYK